MRKYAKFPRHECDKQTCEKKMVDWIKITTLIKKIKKRQTTYKSVITIIYSRCRCWTEIYTPASIYLLKVNNRNTRTRCEICLKLTIKTPEGCQVSFWWNRNNKNTLPSNFFYLQWKLACIVVNNLLRTYLLISQEKKTIQLKSVSYSVEECQLFPVDAKMV